VLPVSGRTAELLPRVHVYVVKSVGLALVTLQVSVVELPSCTTGGDAVSSISGITELGRELLYARHLIGHCSQRVQLAIKPSWNNYNIHYAPMLPNFGLLVDVCLMQTYRQLFC